MKKTFWKNGLSVSLAVLVLALSLFVPGIGAFADPVEEPTYESIGLNADLMDIWKWNFRNWWDNNNPWSGYAGEPIGRSRGADGSLRFGGRKAFVSANVTGGLHNKMLTFMMNKQFSGEVHLGLAKASWSSLWIGYDPGFDFVISDSGVRFVKISTTGTKQATVASAEFPEGLYVPNAYNQIEMGVFGDLTGDRTMILRVNGTSVLEHTIPAAEIHDAPLNCIQIMQDTTNEDFLFIKNIPDEFTGYNSADMGSALGEAWTTANWWNGGSVEGGMSLDASGLHMWNQKAFNSPQNANFSNNMIAFLMQYDPSGATDPLVRFALAANPGSSAPWSGNDAFWFSIDPKSRKATFAVRSNGTTLSMPTASIPKGCYIANGYNKVELGVLGEPDGDRVMVLRINGVEVHQVTVAAANAPDILTTSMRIIQDGYTNDIWLKEVPADISAPEISSFGTDLGKEWTPRNWWNETASNIGRQWISDDGVVHRFTGQKGFVSPAKAAYKNSLLAFLMEADLSKYLVFGLLGQDGASRLHPSYEFIFYENTIDLVVQPGWKKIASVPMADTAYIPGGRNKIEIGVFGAVGEKRTMVLKINDEDTLVGAINAAFAPAVETTYVYIQQDIGSGVLSLRNVPEPGYLGDIPDGATPEARLRTGIRSYVYKEYTSVHDLQEYFEYAVNDPGYTVEISDFNKIAPIEGARDSTGILVPGHNGYLTAVVTLTAPDSSKVNIGVCGRIAPTYVTYEFASVSSASDFELSEDGKTLLTYTGEAEKLVIPEGVETIDDLWMYGEPGNVKALILPESLKKLPKDIAWGMKQSLEVVYMGDRVTTPAGNDFAGCFALKHIRLSENLTHISDAMFDSTVSLAALHIPASVTKIGPSAFKRSLIRQVTLPKTVEVIGANAFSWPCENPYVFTNAVLNSALTSEQAAALDPYIKQKLYDENGYIPRVITVLNPDVEYTGPAYIVDDTGAWSAMTVRAPAGSTTETVTKQIKENGYAISFVDLDMTRAEVAINALRAADDLLLTNDSTGADVLNAVKASYLTSADTSAVWTQAFALTPATATIRGTATGLITLTVDGVDFEIALNRSFGERYFPEEDKDDDSDDDNRDDTGSETDHEGNVNTGSDSIAGVLCIAFSSALIVVLCLKKKKKAIARG